MKIFKYCVLYIAAMAIFLQVLGVNVDSLSDKLQDTGFIFVMTQENGATEAVDMIINPLGEQSAEENIQKVGMLLTLGSLLWGIIAALSSLVFPLIGGAL
ncbi:hypothetical protein CEV08_07640 [Bartonella tribocorum]|uniref:Uncharacterized protein n=1 Tax=Bartonella tribocorum TaxID=85701 RepID=A0A2M6UR33_9HYPH|nr:hypothetical protein CEV08_07640 [Bartonella tribocorum]